MSQLPPSTPSPQVPEPPPPPRPFRRSRSDKKLAGLCGAFAQYYGWDPTLVRLLFVVGVFVTGGALAMAYLIGWIIVPDEAT